MCPGFRNRPLDQLIDDLYHLDARHACLHRVRESGRRVFDLTDGWDGVPAAGEDVFVVTHAPPTDWKSEVRRCDLGSSTRS